MDLAATLPARLRQAARLLVDGVLPPRCLACGEPDALCAGCWSSMTFFAPPWCAVCGLTYTRDDRYRRYATVAMRNRQAPIKHPKPKFKLIHYGLPMTGSA